MTVTYTLVNPQVIGSMKTQIKADNSLKAAKQFYKSLSEHFNNTIPKFHFTIQKGGSGKGKYYHFKVTEEKDGEEVDFTLEPIQLSNDAEALERFETRVNGFRRRCNQAGGAKASKDDKLFDVDDDETSRVFYSLFPTVYDYPIGYFWYDPYVYNLNMYFVPTFYPYITPFIEIVGF